ncbi:hypothetical protein COW36_02400 [bacterium (Candidatus Blackallbacteria) CG17_big_fil_post_rev_8_21_14_2_50_48_46]|uniref:Histidine kinase n=1 Tax=bacterium (Candidatus Blackallbacteria) CG17_big_fil_post_rev_8_21_14_2_50_48_46 TaxID=2014261 RepID=A0A2M7GA09_9BACT|nr:MAG: hypothetical protein COW64_13070 [bacterium (Candidatus Blackallbacteria) CG18_big_fil_WC_8_21_14_2_50_49_26]PIW18980.1 MAG: hypothetical protein COW36_02400 [bacterium (Candidatus Blackallbacteria) CG17_big_fil_post_rev_8_21_14_2_50_48_46]
MTDFASLRIAYRGSDLPTEVKKALETFGVAFELPTGSPDLLMGTFSAENATREWQTWRQEAPEAWALALVSAADQNKALSWLEQGLIDDYLCFDNFDEAQLKRGLLMAFQHHQKSLLAKQKLSARLSGFSEIMLDLLAEFSEQGIYLYASPSHLTTLGYSPEELKGHSLFDWVHPEDQGLVAEGLEILKSQNHYGPIECRYRHKNGHYLWLSCQASQFHDEQHRSLMVGARDITHLKETQFKLERSLQNREYLLQEVYHRVKNNLQVISSMLSLQARRSEDPQTSRVLRETQNRILTMALAHEKLYESHNLEKIDIAEYLRDLSQYLFHAYGMGLSAISLEHECESVHMDIDQSISCGLIVNELLSNAIKFAFPKHHTCENCVISLKIRSLEPDLFELVVRDNGIGLPSQIEPLSPQTLGLRLVNSLSRQLGGRIFVDNESGTRISILFPRQREAP